MPWKAPQLPAGRLALAQAIARVEGFYAKGTAPNRPQRDHNPGDLEYDAFTRSMGAIGTDGRFAIFATDEAGFAALAALLKGPRYAGLTVREAINRYAPPCENNTRGYVEQVCIWTGCQPSDKVVDALV